MHQECTVTTNAHPPAPLERTCTHPHKPAMTSAYLTGPFSRILLRARIRVTPAAIVTGAQRVGIASARLNAVGEASATRVSRRPHVGSASATRVSLRPHAGSASATRVLRRPHAGSVSVARAAPHSGAADHEHRLRASCQTVGIAAECVVTVRIISSLRVSVALILCG